MTNNNSAGRLFYRIKDMYVYFYILVIANYFIYMLLPSYGTGLVNSILLIITFIPFTSVCLRTKYNWVDIIIFIYIFWNLTTILFYLSNGLPVSVFIKEGANSLLPVLFYFIAKLNCNVKNRFYKYMVYACFFCFVVGFYLHHELPNFYIRHLSRNPSFYLSNFVKSGRFASFLSSIQIGSLGTTSAFISVHMLNTTKQKKYLLFTIISIFAVMISLQRSAILMVLISMSGYWIYILVRKKKTVKSYFTMILVIISVIVISMTIQGSEFFVKNDTVHLIITRLLSSPDAISLRSGQWVSGMKATGSNILWGTGLGSVGNKSIGYSDITVTDGNYFKIIYEIGLIGFFLFVIIILAAIKKGISNYKHYIVEVNILLIFLFQAVGNNILTNPTIAFLFWFVIGVLINDRPKDRKRH